MPMKKYKPEQIVTLLRQIELEIANGKTAPQACRDAAITAQTYYPWRKEFGGLKLDQAKRLKELERENAKAVFGETDPEGTLQRETSKPRHSSGDGRSGQCRAELLMHKNQALCAFTQRAA